MQGYWVWNTGALEVTFMVPTRRERLLQEWLYAPLATTFMLRAREFWVPYPWAQ